MKLRSPNLSLTRKAYRYYKYSRRCTIGGSFGKVHRAQTAIRRRRMVTGNQFTFYTRKKLVREHNQHGRGTTPSQRMQFFRQLRLHWLVPCSESGPPLISGYVGISSCVAALTTLRKRRPLWSTPHFSGDPKILPPLCPYSNPYGIDSGLPVMYSLTEDIRQFVGRFAFDWPRRKRSVRASTALQIPTEWPVCIS